MNNNIILVIGSNGQLGKGLRAVSKCYPHLHFDFLTRQDINLENVDTFSKLLEEKTFGCLINASSYNKVDLAEKERERASLVNHVAVKRMAESCQHKKAVFFHVSTDYVFDGKQQKPYDETSPTSPLNFYGFSKMMGEQATLEYCSQAIIVRTSWVISKYGENFVPKIMKAMQKKKEIKVVNDQISSPTYAQDLAEAILKIYVSDKLKKWYNNIFHYSSMGEASRYDLAIFLKEKINSNGVAISPCSSEEFPNPAQRPFYSYMNKHKIKEAFGLDIPTWQETIECFLDS